MSFDKVTFSGDSCIILKTGFKNFLKYTKFHITKIYP